MKRGWPSLALFLYAAPAAALHLPSVFGNGMVLQSGRPLPVWGRSDPGQTIRVLVAGKEARTKADSKGYWKAWLPPLASGGPYDFTVEGEYKVSFSDVLIGEVWVLAGPGPLGPDLREMEGGAEEAAQADKPTLRFFQVEDGQSPEPREDMEGTWQPCSPDKAGAFAARAYLFGKALQDKLKVPLGLVLASWPGTNLETWLPAPALASSPQFKPLLDRWARLEGGPEDHYSKNWDFDFLIAGLEFLPRGGGKSLKVGFTRDEAAGALGTYWGPYVKEGSKAEFKVISLAQGGLSEAAHFFGSLLPGGYSGIAGNLKEEDSKTKTVDLSAYESVRYHLQGRGSLRLGLNQPSITDYDLYKSEPVTAQGTWQEIVVKLADLKQGGWGAPRPFTQDAVEGVHYSCDPPYPGQPRRPSSLYNAMVKPLAGLGARGLIFIEGGRDGERDLPQKALDQAMIRAWKQDWGRDKTAFLLPLAPARGSESGGAGGSALAAWREAQSEAALSAGASPLLMLDRWQENPRPPEEEARQFARLLSRGALEAAYPGKTASPAPRLKSWKILGSEIHLIFSGPLKSLRDDESQGFIVAGPDHAFHPGKGRIQGASLVVSSLSVPTPLSVRYGWADSPRLDLAGENGGLVAPFRTDSWEIASSN